MSPTFEWNSLQKSSCLVVSHHQINTHCRCNIFFLNCKYMRSNILFLNTRYTKIITFLVMLKIKWTNFFVLCEKLQALGLGLLIAGILVKINALSSDVTPALNSVEVAGYKLGDLANNLSIVFIVIGAFIVLVSGLGLIGGCCEVRWMLVVVLI